MCLYLFPVIREAPSPVSTWPQVSVPLISRHVTIPDGAGPLPPWSPAGMRILLISNSVYHVTCLPVHCIHHFSIYRSTHTGSEKTGEFYFVCVLKKCTIIPCIIRYRHAHAPCTQLYIVVAAMPSVMWITLCKIFTYWV